MNLPSLNKSTICIIGLGYVGLPLAIQFEKKNRLSNSNRKIIGFDISEKRILELQNSNDITLEISTKELQLAKRNIEFTSNIDLLNEADIFIVTVPTPIDDFKNPNLSPLRNASEFIGKAIKNKLKYSKINKEYINPIIIYESTVFPGATEEICVPIIEKASNLKYNNDFFCGYSPERINPGDKKNSINDITKITSGSNEEVADWVNNLYSSIISAGTYKASSIKVAEAAKVIENTQRDINIALVNEFSFIFKKLNIDTLDVLEAAGTKWNFLPFKPGLVGGHCIGVDPYYLTYKSQQVGYYPQVVLAGRRINDHVSQWLVEQLILEMSRRKFIIGGSEILILGLTFKENCPDTRNSKVFNIISCLKKYDIKITIIDPVCNDINLINNLNILNEIPKNKKFTGIIAAVAHTLFQELNSNDWSNLVIENGVLLDVKGIIPRSLNAIRL